MIISDSSMKIDHKRSRERKIAIIIITIMILELAISPIHTI
jgi:hypothetical protein